MNILKAFLNIATNESYKLKIKEITYGNNRANNMGEGLEIFVKNAFSNNFAVLDQEKWNTNFAKTFSFSGSKMKMPDMVLRNAEAIEVKKTENLNSLQLNSSHPKSKLFSTSKIDDKCRDCEGTPWEEKDIIYVMGQVPKKSDTLKSLWFVYGTCYAAEKKVYQDVIKEIKDVLKSNTDPKLEINIDGDEIASIANIDALKITNLRVRNMWVIKHPSKVYRYLHEQKKEDSFTMVGILPAEKYKLLPEKERLAIEGFENIEVLDKEIPDPNNSANLISIKLLKFIVS